MPLVAESAWHGWAWNPNDDLFSATWDLDFRRVTTLNGEATALWIRA